MNRSFLTILAVVGICSLGSTGAFAANSQATAAINDGVVGCSVSNSTTENTATMSCQNIFTGAKENTTSDNFVTVMHKSVQLSASQSLFVSPSLVTGLYTSTKNNGGNNTKTQTSTSTSVAEGGVFMRAVLVSSSGKVIVGEPVASCSADAILGCYKNSSNVYGVTLNQRVQTLTSALSSCITSSTGVDCNTSEFVGLVLQTTSAHTFNFIFSNVGQGTYALKIQAAVNSSATTDNGTAVGAAAFGLGDVLINTVRLVHGFSF